MVENNIIMTALDILPVRIETFGGYSTVRKYVLNLSMLIANRIERANDNRETSIYNAAAENASDGFAGSGQRQIEHPFLAP